jgi:acetyl esterase/lipase
VFVLYCTADVHIGNASITYGEGNRPIHHGGFPNVSAVLRWVAARGFRPRTVVVTGTSAGSYGALFYTVPIARLFPDASVVLMGDSGVPLLSRNADVLKKWGTESVAAALWRTEPSPVTLLDAYRKAAGIGQRVRLAMITSDQDSIQSAFYLISGSLDWRPATYSLLADVQAAVPAFRTFIVAGSDHGLVHTDAFYSYREGGVLLHDWVRRLVAGEAVENVRCATCMR